MRAVIVLLAGLLQAQTPELTLQVQSVSNVRPSPDGALAVYTQTRHIVDSEKSEQRSQVWLASADGSKRRALTADAVNATAPEFSPDSRQIYYRTNPTNLWRVSVDGGAGQPLIRDWTGQISQFAPSPDGRFIAFAGARTDPEAAVKTKEKRDFRVIGENPRNHTLWLLPLTNEASPPKRLTTAHTAHFHWSPDSRTIVFEHWPTPGADDWIRSDLAEVSIESSAITDLTRTPNSESQPYYSPDGRYIAYVQTPPKARWPRDARLAIRDRRTGATRLLPPTEDESPLLLGWEANSASLVYAEMKRTRSALYAMPLDGPPRLIYEPKQGTFFAGYNPNANLNAAGAHWGFAQESSAVAPEAFVAPIGKPPVQISQANHTAPVAETKAIQWKSKDGQLIEGLLTLPAGRGPFPLILNIHGGPANYFSETFIGKAGIYPLAAFAARGYAVLRPNPRGSGGYGKTFRFANVSDWGGKDYDDIMSGVDHLIANGTADPARMAVMGWSYGGYMTSWIVTHTHRFKAAAIGAAVTNLWSFTGTSDIPGFIPDYFQGEPWEVFSRYRYHSPMTYVKGVTTPSLILHGETDDRVPISQSYELHNALKRQGVPVEMVVYPRTGHGPQEPKFLLDLMHRHLDWVDRHLKTATPTR